MASSPAAASSPSAPICVTSYASSMAIAFFFAAASEPATSSSSRVSVSSSLVSSADALEDRDSTFLVSSAILDSFSRTRASVLASASSTTFCSASIFSCAALSCRFVRACLASKSYASRRYVSSSQASLFAVRCVACSWSASCSARLDASSTLRPPAKRSSSISRRSASIWDSRLETSSVARVVAASDDARDKISSRASSTSRVASSSADTNDAFSNSSASLRAVCASSSFRVVASRLSVSAIRRSAESVSPELERVSSVAVAFSVASPGSATAAVLVSARAAPEPRNTA
mmetsp:Transcript_2851/g.11330  ORF Transcript_2851/g.11330 Transcript_2851/m.11330 type:complete len:290 (-) Transcript_2851:473-1342(-)